MKKILSVVLALTMLATLGLTAFAAANPIEEDTDQFGETIVKTVIDPAANLESYSVTIPANIDIAWNDTAAQDLNYAVTSQLKLGASLKVTATAKDAALMNGTNALAYTAAGLDTECVFGEINTDAAPATAITLSVPDFADVPIAVYETTITYTAEYVAPTAP